MKRTSFSMVVLALAAMLVPAAQAQTLQVLTVGSSAQFGPFAVAAYALATAGGVKAYHYTVKAGIPGALVLHPFTDPVFEGDFGDLWVVWSANGIWAYLSIDSTVGVRAFQASPRAVLSLYPLEDLPLSSLTNFPFWPDNTKDTALTQAVYNAINGHPFTAANTDIRPEDALFATTNALTNLRYGQPDTGPPPYYYPDLIGYPIQSHFTTRTATPIAFVLSGSDPFSGQPVSPPIVLPVGAAPLVFLVNISPGSGTSTATNLKVEENNTNNASALFSGTGKCAGNLLDGVASTVALNPILNEPLSGAMNVAEFTDFQADNGYSQETGISGNNEPPGSDGNSNPLMLPCTSGSGLGSFGHRYRAIGADDMITAVHATVNGVGYALFSNEPVNSSLNNTNYRYVTLDGVDPINATYTAGILPSCPTTSGHFNCPQAPGRSFPHLRDGTYRSWSIYRMLTDINGLAATQKLIAQTLVDVNLYVPDFVPFSPICRTSPTGSDEPGLDVYRQHFTPAGQTVVPNDGPQQLAVQCKLGGRHTLPYLTLGGVDSTGQNTEEGGDVGGLIVGPNRTAPVPPGPTGQTEKNN